jgi:hypothetical protein
MHPHARPLDDQHAYLVAFSTRALHVPFDEPFSFEALWTVLYHVLVTRYLIVASFALGFYDYFLTLPQERAYVWNSRPSLVRNIYFFVRYSYFPIGILTLYGPSVLSFRLPSRFFLPKVGCNSACAHVHPNVPQEPFLSRVSIGAFSCEFFE